MTQHRMALSLSLGLFFLPAWANETLPTESMTAETMTTGALTALHLGIFGVVLAITIILFLLVLRQRSILKEQDEQLSSLKSANQNLETIVAEQNSALADAKAQANQTRATNPTNQKVGHSSTSDINRAEQHFDEALIDIAVGVKRVRGKEDRYQALLVEFISRKPNLVTQITEYVGRSDMQGAKEFSREMKEATGDLALDSLHFCLEDLENAFIEDDLTAIHQKLVDLGRAWRITEREVQKYLHVKSAS